jgi:hypothetical protein
MIGEKHPDGWKILDGLRDRLETSFEQYTVSRPPNFNRENTNAFWSSAKRETAKWFNMYDTSPKKMPVEAVRFFKALAYREGHATLRIVGAT